MRLRRGQVGPVFGFRAPRPTRGLDRGLRDVVRSLEAPEQRECRDGRDGDAGRDERAAERRGATSAAALGLTELACLFLAIATLQVGAAAGSRGRLGRRATGPLLLLRHQIAAPGSGAIARVLSVLRGREAVLRREVEGHREVDARAQAEAMPRHDRHLGALREDPRGVAGEVVGRDDHAILAHRGVLHASVVEPGQLRDPAHRSGRVVPDHGRAVLEGMDRTIELLRREGVVHPGREGPADVGVRSRCGRRRRRRWTTGVRRLRSRWDRSWSGGS